MAELDEGEGEGSGLLETLEARNPDKLAPEPAPAPEEPVAEAASAPAPEPEAKPQVPPGYVPIGEVQKERARRRDLEERLARLEGRIDEQSRARTEPAKAAEPVDDLQPPPEELYNQNAAEYLKQVAEYNAKLHQREIDKINGQIDAHKAELAQEAQQREQARQIQQLDTAYAQASNAYWQQTPEARDAYQAFATTRMKQLARLGYTPERAHATLAHEERTIAWQALNSDRNPAQVIHEMMLDAGWQPAKAADPPPPPPPADPQPSRDERRRAASTSLSQASGGAAHAPGLGDVANMSNEEFAAWKKKGGRVEDMIGKRVA